MRMIDFCPNTLIFARIIARIEFYSGNAKPHVKRCFHYKLPDYPNNSLIYLYKIKININI